MTTTDRRITVLFPLPYPSAALQEMGEQVNNELAGPRFEYTFRAVKTSAAWLDSDYDSKIFDIAVFEAGLEAAGDGADAICIGTASDSGLVPLRSRLEIPVVGPGQTQFHLAALLGDRFSVLTMWDRWVHLYEKTAHRTGLEDKLASIRHVDKRPDFVNLLEGHEDVVFPRLIEQGQAAVDEDGAEVLCLGSTTMQAAVPTLREELPVPVLNPGPIAFKMTELLLDLGYTQSPKAYPGPEVPMDDKIHAMLDAVAGEFTEYDDV